MIKSSKCALKFCNSGKLQSVHRIIDEYKVVMEKFVELLWLEEKPCKFVPKSITSQVKTWLSARMIQCAGKQASGVVRGTKTKQKRREYVKSKLMAEGKHKKARKLQRFIDEVNISKPELNHIQPELDSRFVQTHLDQDSSFDGWIRLASIGNKTKLNIPFRKSKHFNKMLKSGKLKTGIRLSKKRITFMFEIPDVKKKSSGAVLGIDVGQTSTIACSNGHLSTANAHGHDLKSISDILCRKKKGSKGFGRTTQHRKNYINWSINQLNLSKVKEVKIENIKNMRKGKITSRRLGHWTYTNIFEKLSSRCEEQGVLVTRVNPTYTSKRCSGCGWTRSSNRKGKLFKCNLCGLSMDSDLNAALNIAAPLKPIPFKKRQRFDIKEGFYWQSEGTEPIVPCVPKTQNLFA